MIEEIQTLEGEIVSINQIDGELNKVIEYIEPTTQVKTITPTKQEQEVKPDEGIFALSKVIVEPIGEEYIIPTGTEEISYNGLYNVKNKEYANVSISPNLQNKSLSITSNTTTNIQADENYDGLENVSITTNVQPNLQEKSITITSNTQTTIEKDNNYDGMSSVVVTTNVPPVNEWTQYGYSSSPSFITTMQELCDTIRNEYDTSLTSLYQKYKDRTDIYIFPLVDTSNVTSMARMFYNCSNLKNVPLLNTSNVENFGYMFYSCTGLLDVPLFNTSNGTNFEYMFASCSVIKEIPQIDVSKGNTYRYMFTYCSSLETAPALNYRVGGSVSFNSLFSQCAKLKNVSYFDISEVYTKNSLLDMFRGCKLLTDTSVNNILKMCSENSVYTGTKTLYHLGFRSTEISQERIEALSNYQAFINAGWTTGY